MEGSKGEREGYEGARERGGQRGDTTRVVHPVLDDEQVETRTTTASYPRPPDRSINGEIDAFSGQTDRVRGMLGRTSIFHPAGGDHVHREPLQELVYRRRYPLLFLFSLFFFLFSFFSDFWTEFWTERGGIYIYIYILIEINGVKLMLIFEGVFLF